MITLHGMMDLWLRYVRDAMRISGFPGTWLYIVEIANISRNRWDLGYRAVTEESRPFFFFHTFSINDNSKWCDMRRWEPHTDEVSKREEGEKGVFRT